MGSGNLESHLGKTIREAIPRPLRIDLRIDLYHVATCNPYMLHHNKIYYSLAICLACRIFPVAITPLKE
jgi:hypothetical protein